MRSACSIDFNQQRPLVIEDFLELSAGRLVSLVLLERLPAGGSALFAVQYIHSEVIFRSPGERDAVALGQARLVDSDTEYREVRIIFSRPNKTATLRGLVLEGQVKAGQIVA